VVVSQAQERHLTAVKTKLQPHLKRTGRRYDTTAMHVGSYVTVSRGRLRSIPASYSGSPGLTPRCENRVSWLCYRGFSLSLQQNARV